ncbi:MAG TPA: hypothetical protein DCY13_18990, partial [Verrucomicrobiales bacterium]|nr:hypothetical protein [Verrucomicrobiales bacterium]
MSATIEAAELKRYLGERRAHGAPSSRSASSANRDQAVAQEPNPASDAQRVGVPARATTDRTERELGAPAATGRQECRPSGCAVLESSGRTFPVDVHFAARPSYENRSPVWEQAADAFAHFVGSGGEGDVLVFMPGAYEIHRTIEAIKQTREAKGFLVLPLHGELQPRDQDAAVARYQQRKVVIATNVAETSLTIDGIRLVIDSGLARIPRFDPYRGINTLLIEKISRASA